jgi:hypothetical protein
MNDDIFYHIMSYTIRPQSKELLEDIKSYYLLKNKIYSYYYENNIDEPKYFIYVDLCIYFAEKKKIKNLIKTCNGDIISHINCIFGILTKYERLEFLNWYNLK